MHSECTAFKVVFQGSLGFICFPYINIFNFWRRKFCCYKEFPYICIRFGFLMDSSCLADMVEVSPSCLSSLTKEVYVHHSGCALLQPVFDEEYINDVGISSQSFNKDDRNSCGFHWYRNHYYLRQKFTPVSVFTQHDKLYQQLQHFCQHSENGLDELISLCLDSLKPFSD